MLDLVRRPESLPYLVPHFFFGHILDSAPRKSRTPRADYVSTADVFNPAQWPPLFLDAPCRGRFACPCRMAARA